jgi:hypothetical protein
MQWLRLIEPADGHPKMQETRRRMSRSRGLPLVFRADAAAWLLVPPLFGLGALLLGQDANWDLRNYHYYNPFAWLHGRLDVDVAPAQVATYYNPLLHLPFYLAVQRLPPRALGFILGTLQGLNFPLLVILARQALHSHPRSSPAERTTWAWCAALLGMLGAGGISELGTSFGDALLSLPLLAALTLMLHHLPLLCQPRSGPGLAWAAAAGLLAGTAAGLKQPMAVYAVGLCLSCFALPTAFPRRVSLAFGFGIGTLAGIGLTSGFWLLEMASRFGNPFFPYFNQFFRSEMATIGDYRDTRFLPRSLSAIVAAPLRFAAMPKQLAEVPFRDLRWVMFYLLLIPLAVRVAAQRLRPGAAGPDIPACPASSRLLLTFGLTSYAAWLLLFAIFRYAMLLEMLIPLGIVLAVNRLCPAAPARRLALAAGALVLITTLQPADWERVAWGRSYFGVQPPPLEQPERTVVLMAGLEPTAYLIPFFPHAVRFLRIQSYFTGPSAQPNGLDRRMQRVVAAHDGPLLALFRSYEREAVHAALRFYGLKLTPGSCAELRPHIESHIRYPLLLCPVERHGPTAPAAPSGERP